MIYYKLGRGVPTYLTVVLGTFAGQTDTGAGLDQAMAHPVDNLTGQQGRVASRNPCCVDQGMWYRAEQLVDQGCDGFIVGNLSCCAAVLAYDGASNLLNVGHAQGGHINGEQLVKLRDLYERGEIQHIIYATPTLSTGSASVDEDYKEQISLLAGMNANCSIHIIDGFGKDSGTVEGTVSGDMSGNICFF